MEKFAIMVLDELLSLISNGENEFVEFKKAEFELPKSLFDTVCAFLNRNGGHIILGVDDDKTILGCIDGCVDS